MEDADSETTDEIRFLTKAAAARRDGLPQRQTKRQANPAKARLRKKNSRIMPFSDFCITNSFQQEQPIDKGGNARPPY